MIDYPAGSDLQIELVRNQDEIDLVEALLSRGVESRASLLSQLQRLENERDALLAAKDENRER